MSEKHLFEGQEILVGEEPPPGFSGFTVSEEDFMKMQEAGVLKVVKAKDKTPPDLRKKRKLRKNRKKLSKLNKRKNR